MSALERARYQPELYSGTMVLINKSLMNAHFTPTAPGWGRTSLKSELLSCGLKILEIKYHNTLGKQSRTFAWSPPTTTTPHCADRFPGCKSAGGTKEEREFHMTPDSPLSPPPHPAET